MEAGTIILFITVLDNIKKKTNAVTIFRLWSVDSKSFIHYFNPKHSESSAGPDPQSKLS